MRITTKPTPWAAGALLLVALGAVVEDRRPSSISVRTLEPPAGGAPAAWRYGSRPMRSFNITIRNATPKSWGELARQVAP